MELFFSSSHLIIELHEMHLQEINPTVFHYKIGCLGSFYVFLCKNKSAIFTCILMQLLIIFQRICVCAHVCECTCVFLCVCVCVCR